MKKLVILALAFITFQANAQDNNKEKRQENKKERLEKRMELEPQEVAELQTKKMTLHLDLTEAQQKKVMALNLENATKRKENSKNRSKNKEGSKKERPTKEERLKRMNAQLDAKIATKQKMKTILNAAQFEKWENSEMKKGDDRQQMRRDIKDKKSKKGNQKGKNRE